MSTTFERIDLSEYDEAVTVGLNGVRSLQCGITEEEERFLAALRAAYAEIDRLRANALGWKVVTDDPATLPEKGRPVFIQSGRYYFAGHRNRGVLEWIINPRESSCGIYPVSPGDRWAYIPEVQS